MGCGVVFVEVEGFRLLVDVEAVLPEIPQTHTTAHELAEVVVPSPVDHVRERVHVGDIEEGQRVECLVGELMDIWAGALAFIGQRVGECFLAGNEVSVRQTGFSFP